MIRNKKKQIFKPFEYCMRMVKQGMGVQIFDSPEYKALNKSSQMFIDKLALKNIPTEEAELVDG